ncbi:hypothetical protein AJ88_01420 [Mesorhizobium amorphae CCBAU 01583]|nr:hypothetical protein AJ88_01420 [Mesorhizobium amorphae CCBAU 01583]
MKISKRLGIVRSVLRRAVGFGLDYGLRLGQRAAQKPLPGFRAIGRAIGVVLSFDRLPFVPPRGKRLRPA